MSSEQELRVKLKAVEEEIKEARGRVHQLEITHRDLIRNLHTEIHGVKAGDIVEIEKTNGKLKAGQDLLVTEVDDRWLRSNTQPKIRVKYRTKSGEWSRDDVAVYGSWKVKQ